MIERIDSSSDSDALQRATSGDAEAFGVLVARHIAAARRVATVVMGDRDGVDDVVQEATIRSWQRLDTFRPGAEFRPWYLKVVANTARNHLRGSGRRGRLQLRAAAREVTEAGGVDEVVVVREEHREVLEALNRLDEADRLVLALRHFEAMSEAQMAEVLDCAPGTVKSRLSRATARLRKELSS